MSEWDHIHGTKASSGIAKPPAAAAGTSHFRVPEAHCANNVMARNAGISIHAAM
jgi:hypothetical protein